MGCCGCTLHASAIVAVVFGFVQGLVGLILGSVFIVRFDTTRSYFSPSYVISRWSALQICRSISEAHVAFNVIWIVSSILLIIGIIKEHPWLHRQWTIVTSCSLVIDAIMFIVGCTQLQYLYEYSYSYNGYGAYYSMNFQFILFLGMLSRFGIVGLVCDICLAIYVAQRAAEIVRGPLPTTHIIVTTGQQPVHIMPPGQSMVIPGQTMYVQPGQQLYTQPGQQMYTQPGQKMYTQPGQQLYGQPGQQMYTQPGQQMYGQPSYQVDQMPDQTSKPPAYSMDSKDDIHKY